MDPGEEGAFEIAAGRVEVTDESAGVHDHDPVRDPGDLVEVVAADQDRGAGRGAFEQGVAQDEHARRIEGVAGLIQDNESGCVLESRGEADALPVAKGEASDPAVGDALQPPPPDGLHGAARTRVPEPGSEIEVGCHGELRVSERHLDQLSDLTPGAGWHLRQGVAVDADLSGVGTEHAEREPHQGGLAGSVQADERDDLSRTDRQLQIVYAGAAGEGATDPVELEHGQRSPAASDRAGPAAVSVMIATARATPFSVWS